MDSMSINSMKAGTPGKPGGGQYQLVGREERAQRRAQRRQRKLAEFGGVLGLTE